MRVALIARDKPGALQVRIDTRADHVAFLKGSDSVERAGPLLDGNGTMISSLIVLRVGSMAEAEAFVAADPYGKAGLFASVDLMRWDQVIG